MHNCTIKKQSRPNSRRLVGGLHWIALIGLVVLPCLGIIPAGYAGWITDPPVRYAEPPRRRARRFPRQRCSWRHFHWRAAWDYACRSYHRVGWQVWLLVTLSGLLPGEVHQETPVSWWAWCVLGLPVVRWMVAVSAVAWPFWGQSWLCRGLRWGLYRLFQLTVLVMVTADMYHSLDKLETPLGQVMGVQGSPWSSGGGVPPLALWNRPPLQSLSWKTYSTGLALGGLVREAEGWRVPIDLTEDGTYEITLEGPQGDRWFIRYRPVDEFDRRMFLIFLRHPSTSSGHRIWTPEDTPARPFLRQEWHLSCTAKYRAGGGV